MEPDTLAALRREFLAGTVLDHVRRAGDLGEGSRLYRAEQLGGGKRVPYVGVCGHEWLPWAIARLKGNLNGHLRRSAQSPRDFCGYVMNPARSVERLAPSECPALYPARMDGAG